MTATPMHYEHEPQYEPFLYAPVGEDSRGTTVTVLSMLARLGVDPWGEASALAGMQDGEARRRLDMLMARFSDVSSSGASRDKVVSRLVACLPRQTRERPANGLAQPSNLNSAAPLVWVAATALLLAYVAMRATGN